MTIEEMRKRKRELGLTGEMLSELSGVPLGTVQKVFGGATKAPRRKTLEALARVLETDPYTVRRDVSDDALRDGADPAGEFRETALKYNHEKPERKYTIDDYYALPDEQRVELIDGKFYDMPVPALIHQELLGELHIAFRECIKRHGMDCKVYLAPCDVRLDMDDYTMVQPDLLVLCRKIDFLHAKRWEGAPDLVIEILSPATRSKDMLLKLYKYQNAGVREYWIVDPKFMKVTVHYFDCDDYDPVQYTFRDRIPVRISEGKCYIDFAEISDNMGMEAGVEI